MSQFEPYVVLRRICRFLDVLSQNEHYVVKNTQLTKNQYISSYFFNLLPARFHKG